MKLLAAIVLALLTAAPDARFETGGVRVGEVLVQGTVLELQSGGAASLLASGSSIEALSSSVAVELSAGRTLTLDPGVRITRNDGGFLLSTHGDRRIRFSAAGESFDAVSPALLAVRGEGWILGEKTMAGGELRVGLAGRQQDDTDSNLERMKESSKKIRTGEVPKLNSRMVRRFWGNPLLTSQAVDTISIRQVPRISPSGAP